MITGKTPYISTVSLLSRPVNTAAAGVVSAATGSEDKSIQPVSSTDKVHLSDPGLNLLPSEQQEQDGVQSEKVRELKQAIEENRYHIDSRKIAEKLLREASELMYSLTGLPSDPMQTKEKADNESGQHQSPQTSSFGDVYTRPKPHST